MKQAQLPSVSPAQFSCWLSSSALPSSASEGEPCHFSCKENTPRQSWHQAEGEEEAKEGGGKGWRQPSVRPLWGARWPCGWGGDTTFHLLKFQGESIRVFLLQAIDLNFDYGTVYEGEEMSKTTDVNPDYDDTWVDVPLSPWHIPNSWPMTKDDWLQPDYDD